MKQISEKNKSPKASSGNRTQFNPEINPGNAKNSNLDNIFYNDFTKRTTARNIATCISDHLTQFLIIRDQTTNFYNNRKKEVSKIRKFNKESFSADLTQIDWNNYLKLYKNDTDLSFELFLRKINFL